MLESIIKKFAEPIFLDLIYDYDQDGSIEKMKFMLDNNFIEIFSSEQIATLSSSVQKVKNFLQNYKNK